MRDARARPAPGRPDPRARDRVPARAAPHRERVALAPRRGWPRTTLGAIEERDDDPGREHREREHGERHGQRADPGRVRLGREPARTARVAEHLARGLLARGRHEDVARAAGQEVRHVEAARAAGERRDALLEQQALDHLGLGLVARGGDAHQRALGVPGPDLARADGEVGLRRAFEARARGRAAARRSRRSARGPRAARRTPGTRARGHSVTVSSTCSTVLPTIDHSRRSGSAPLTPTIRYSVPGNAGVSESPSRARLMSVSDGTGSERVCEW